MVLCNGLNCIQRIAMMDGAKNGGLSCLFTFFVPMLWFRGVRPSSCLSVGLFCVKTQNKLHF